MKGGRDGLRRLKNVLPNIFKSYPGLPPFEMLIECGLEPIPTVPASEFPTFYFNQRCDGAAMTSKKRSRPEEDDEELFRSQELLEAYEAARSEWSS